MHWKKIIINKQVFQSRTLLFFELMNIENLFSNILATILCKVITRLYIMYTKCSSKMLLVCNLWLVYVSE